MISKTHKQTPIVLALVAAAVAALSIVVGLNLNSAQLSSLETGRQIMPDSSILISSRINGHEVAALENELLWMGRLKIGGAKIAKS